MKGAGIKKIPPRHSHEGVMQEAGPHLTDDLIMNSLFDLQANAQQIGRVK